jgi:HAD superfamily hydrolase (TIGR01662 family)
MNVLLLDRDGTIIRDPGSAPSPDDIELLPGTVEGLTQFRDAGFRFFVITNQAAIGRGLDTEDNYRACTKRMTDILEKHGIVIEQTYHCPDTDDASPRRKPNTGMWEDLIADYPEVSVTDCLMVGDKDADVQFGKNIGCVTARIESDYPHTVTADETITDLRELATIILSHS